MEFSYGHLLQVGPTNSAFKFHFQNYALGQNVGVYGFLPFAFSGAISSLQGDNLDATLRFGNAEITRNFVVEALDNAYVAKITTVLWNPNTYGVQKIIYEYFGACSSGGWDESTIQISLGSVLDAVQANVPGRRLYRKQVGNIPFTAQVNV